MEATMTETPEKEGFFSHSDSPYVEVVNEDAPAPTDLPTEEVPTGETEAPDETPVADADATPEAEAAPGDDTSPDDYEPTQEDIDEWQALHNKLEAAEQDAKLLREAMQDPQKWAYLNQYMQQQHGYVAPQNGNTPNGVNGQMQQMQAPPAQQQEKLERKALPKTPDDKYDDAAWQAYERELDAVVAHNQKVAVQEAIGPYMPTMTTFHQQEQQRQQQERMAAEFARAGADQETARALAREDPATLVQLVVEGRKAMSRTGEKKVPAPPSLPKVPPRRTQKESAAKKVPASGVAASGQAEPPQDDVPRLGSSLSANIGNW